jgi:hypothetical protein
MKVKSHIQRLLSGWVVRVGFMALEPFSSQAGTPDTDLSKDLNRSAFSST